MSFHLEKRAESTAVVSDDRDDYKIADAGNVTATLTAAHLLSGILYSNPGAAITLTLPDAADVIAADSKAISSGGFHFYLRNDGAFTITVAPGANSVLTGGASVTAGSHSHFYVRYTSVAAGAQALTITRIG